MKQKKRFKVLREQKGKRDEFSKTYVLNDRILRKRISGEPINYYDETEKVWKDVISCYEEDENKVVFKNNKFRTEILKQDDNFVKVEKDDMAICWNYLRKTKSDLNMKVDVKKEKGKNHRILQKNADRNVDIEYTPNNKGIKENIIVKRKARKYEYLFSLKLENLEPVISEDKKKIEFRFNDKTEFIIPAPFMYDANKNRSENVTYELFRESEELFLKVIADKEWINDENRVFPVTIDPQVFVAANNYLGFSTQMRSILSKDELTISYGDWGNEQQVTTMMLYGADESTDTRLNINFYDFSILSNNILSAKVYFKLKSGSSLIGTYLSYGDTQKHAVFESVDEYVVCDISEAVINGESKVSLSAVEMETGFTEFETNPYIEIEYANDENERQVKRNYSLAGILDCEVDIKNGGIFVCYDDILPEDSVMGIGISHAIKESDENYSVGKNVRLNLNESLVKYAETSKYIYTDGKGDKYGFNDYYYYIDADGNKKYISGVNREDITVNVDGDLFYNNQNVYLEYKSIVGYSALTVVEGYNNVEWTEQRSEELKQAEERVESYEKAISEYVIVNKTTAKITAKAKNYIENGTKFEKFINNAKETNNILLTEDEAINTYYVESQKSYLIGKKDEHIANLKTYYKEYSVAKKKVDDLRRNTPINFLRNEKIVKGYNENGELVAIFDSYDNYATIEREVVYSAGPKKYRISKIKDKNGKAIEFDYKASKLSCVTDIRGRKTRYKYDSLGNLTRITSDTGKDIVLSYTDGKLTSVENNERKLKTTIEMLDNDNLTLKHYSTKTEEEKLITTDQVKYVEYNRAEIATYTEVIGEKSKEYYAFDYEYKCNEYRKIENGLVTKAEKYEDVPYWKNGVEQSVPHKAVTRTKKSSLYVPNAEFTFDLGENDYESINQYEKPVIKSFHSENISGENQKQKSINYVYDEKQRVIEEITTITCRNSNSELLDSQTKHVKYYYNQNGDVIRTESYISGEELTNGKDIEENIINDKGNGVKTITYNSLDSSSKLYTESELNEKGQVIAEFDETGENKTEKEYVDGTNMVREEKLPNGSRFAYGRDIADNVTAISQSTADGEENSTQRIYENGELRELRSGNNVVKYEYDHKGRITKVDLNGTTDYVNYEYSENDTQETVIETNKKNEVKTVVKDKLNRPISVNNGGISLAYSYNKDKVTAIESSAFGLRQRYEYDVFDRVTESKLAQASNEDIVWIKENLAYDLRDRVVQKAITSDMTSAKTYNYSYDNSDRLTGTEIDGLTIKPKYDMLNRNKGKEIFNGNNKVVSEEINYLKKGDHATNMPVTIWYGDKTSGGFAVKDSIKYTYDNMGNIEKVYENGELAVSYKYDALSRLFREDNKAFNKTTVLVYDTNGNIVKKREYNYTLKEDLTELTYVEKLYTYDGDKLVSYNGEACVYDVMGRPTTYRNKSVAFTNGYMTSYDGTTYEYDGFGRRVNINNLRTPLYDIDDNIVDDNKLTYIYDSTGVAGCYNGTTKYLYRKDTLGNIIAILDTNGLVVAKYAYDAWGNHKVFDASGVEIVDPNHVAIKNPFRYRSYYYDTETGLYYLKARYYDPETGRFISPDSIEYIDPEIINGLNLYAYCGNNPVMNVDPNGNSWLRNAWNKVKKAVRKVGNWVKDNWKEIAIGSAFIVGGALVTALTAGAGVGFMAAFGSALLSSTIQVGTSMAIGVGVNGLTNIINGNDFFDNIGDALASSYMWGGIFSGGAQILGSGFRIAANKGVTTGRSGGIKLGNSSVKILSPDKNNWTKAGGTLIKFGNVFRIDTGAMWGLHMHILSSGHLPLGAIVAGLIRK